VLILECSLSVVSEWSSSSLTVLVALESQHPDAPVG
jgi:hypothetical protein